jgi:hypothetical protein
LGPNAGKQEKTRKQNHMTARTAVSLFQLAPLQCSGPAGPLIACFQWSSWNFTT